MPIKTTQKLITAALLASLTSAASAITNVETVRPGLPDQGFSGNIQLGMDGKSGNSSEQNYLAGAKLILRQDKNIWFGFADYEYGTTQRVRDTNNALVHTRWVRLLSEKWSSEVFVQWQQDEFDNLESRSLAGAGGRYLALKNADVYSVYLGIGAFREREEYDLVSYNETTYITRLNTYLSYKHVINDNLSLVSTTYYQPNVEETSDFRVLWTLGLSVKMAENLKLQLNYQVRKDGDPPQNLEVDPPIVNKETKTEYSTSFVYSF